MEDALWKLFGLLLAAILVVVVPTMSLLERQDDITLALVQAETARFADSARDMGMISPEMYERFEQRLQATGMRYDVRLRHERHAWQPVYETTAAGLVFTGTFERSSVTEGELGILSVLFPPLAGSAGQDPAARQYGMHVGDQFFVEVSSRGDTMASAWRKLFFSREAAVVGIFARAGGMVRNEAP